MVGKAGYPQHTSQKIEGSIRTLSCATQNLHQLTEKKWIKYYHMAHGITQRSRESDLKATHPGPMPRLKPGLWRGDTPAPAT